MRAMHNSDMKRDETESVAFTVTTKNIINERSYDDNGSIPVANTQTT